MQGLARPILLALLIGGALGALLHGRADVLVRYGSTPVGTIWLNLLLVMMLPLASTALILGVLALDGRSLLKTGGRLLGLTLLLTGIAVAVGFALVTLIRPGEGVDLSALPTETSINPASGDAMELLVAQFPSNVIAAAAGRNLVPVLVFCVLFGLALKRTPGEPARRVEELIQGIFDVSVQAIHMVLRLAPIGVGAMTFTMGAKGGLSALAPVATFAGVVLAGLAIQMFVVYPLALRILTRRDILDFFRGARPAMAVAFSTASSAATLPTSLEVAESRLGIPAETARFVLTVGATGNQNGTALFEGVAVIFLAQAWGVELTSAQTLAVIGVAVLGGVGTAGVPGGALPVIAALIVNLGIPEQAIAVLIGVDRLLDMCRTTLNVTGDLVLAAAVAPRGRSEAGAPG